MTDYASSTLDGLDALARTLKAARPSQDPTGDSHPHRTLDTNLKFHQQRIQDHPSRLIHNRLMTLGYTGPIPKLDPEIPQRILHKLTAEILDRLPFSNKIWEHLKSLDIKISLNGCDVNQAGKYSFYGVKFLGDFKPPHLPDDGPTQQLIWNAYVVSHSGQPPSGSRLNFTNADLLFIQFSDQRLVESDLVAGHLSAPIRLLISIWALLFSTANIVVEYSVASADNGIPK
ncbi:hypothetical protein BDN70DRAFT_930450 [Pholiota conissans]|uniref:Uncharacterized protein n=1 Tax=Pholiota conissans TaxID=109636 RepID=A0A9P5Z9I8_9AGAR|nr:hypothetical protein BDN70DRAFT_930450 [Pholiota conissans]